MTEQGNLVEQLAALAHEQWSGWMVYLFKFGTKNPDGTFTMDAEKVERWKRQMSTAYADLSESERESDRVEARRVLALLGVGEGMPTPGAQDIGLFKKARERRLP